MVGQPLENLPRNGSRALGGQNHCMESALVDRYLDRIGLTARPSVDRAGLAALQLAHLRTVPFENLSVAAGIPVSTDPAESVAKVVDSHRGGWCFELNGAFAELLEALGFSVQRLGAAVLLDGPTDVIDHVALEVTLDQAWLVDVGFGESFTQPLQLNNQEPQPGGPGIADFQIIPSWKGHTLAKIEDGVPVAQYRFSRLAREMADFTPASERLQSDRNLHWSNKAFATRIIDDGPERVTLLSDRLKFHGGLDAARHREEPVPANAWTETLHRWFGIEMDHRPGSGVSDAPWTVHDSLIETADREEAVRQIAGVSSAVESSQDAARILELIDQHADIALRTCRPGHLTGSAMVIDPDSKKMLLLFHTKLQKWLQPGGHADGDTNLARVALREAREETGIEDLRVVTPAIDVDIHQVAPPAEDAHLHLDVRFLVLAPGGAVATGNHESEAIEWISLEDLASRSNEAGIQRLARRAFSVCQELEESGLL